MLDVRRLRVLHEVARTGSLTGAARALDYTQPAVSHHVSRLEAEVGTALVVRAGRGVRLTEAGAALARHAADVLVRLERAEEEVAALAGLRAGRVRLVAFPSAGATLLPDALVLLRSEHPKLGVGFAEAEPPEALAALREGEADLAVVFAYPEAPLDLPEDLQAVVLAPDELLAILPNGTQPSHTDGPVALARLRDETWIAGCERCRAHLLHACARAGFTPDIAYETDDAIAVQRLVARGVGVSLLPALSLRAARDPDVVVRRIDPPQPREVLAVVFRDAVRQPAVAAALDALRRAARPA